jgi:N-acetylgalactosamine kinase
VSFLSDSAAANSLFASLYSDSGVIAGKQELLKSLLSIYARRFGDEPVVVSRAPGRLNIMGRHVDHQGGHVNMIALDRDTWVVGGMDESECVRLVNVNREKHGDREFSLRDLLPGYQGGDWRELIDRPGMLERTRAAGGDWSLYVQAPLARLHAKGLIKTGFNIVAGGDIPSAAGLSSSSALVTAAMEAVCALSGIRLEDEQFVELAGEAEWFAGTRGGSGDHAAMKYSRRGKVTQIRFFPLEVTDSVDFPPDYVMMVCASGIEARKSTGARDVFNQRVACYHLGRELFKKAYPELAEQVTHLRDMLPSSLGIPESALLNRLSALPESADRAALREQLPREFLDPLFATHDESVGAYRIRDLIVFGLSECERSRRTPWLLRSGEIEAFGEWMNISHSGDRVDGTIPRSNGPELERIPGAYACSVSGIDRMADIALGVEGVLGAQISGAGLGGCLMVLARAESAESVQKALIREYYEPNCIEPNVFASTLSAGSGIVQ